MCQAVEIAGGETLEITAAADREADLLFYECHDHLGRIEVNADWCTGLSRFKGGSLLWEVQIEQWRNVPVSGDALAQQKRQSEGGPAHDA